MKTIKSSNVVTYHGYQILKITIFIRATYRIQYDHYSWYISCLFSIFFCVYSNVRPKISKILYNIWTEYMWITKHLFYNSHVSVKSAESYNWRSLSAKIDVFFLFPLTHALMPTCQRLSYENIWSLKSFYMHCVYTSNESC